MNPHPIRNLPWAIVVALTCWLHAPALANDRPFQSVRTAVSEDEEAGTWSIETWTQRLGPVRGLSVEPEYRFTAATSVQAEITRLLDRTGEDTGHEAEIEFKHLLTHFERDGYGLGVSLAFSRERPASGDLARRTTFKIPLSVKLGDSGWLVHANAGLITTSGQRRAWVASAAAEKGLTEHSHLFMEAAREGSSRYGQVGVRHWLRSEKLALDIAVQRNQIGAERHAGFIIGLGFYDL